MMEAVLKIKEMEKLLRNNLPHSKVKEWKKDRVIMDIDSSKLKKEMAGKDEILKPKIRREKAGYIICQKKDGLMMFVQ